MLGGGGDGRRTEGDLRPRHRRTDEQLRVADEPVGDVGHDVEPARFHTRQPKRREQRRRCSSTEASPSSDSAAAAHCPVWNSSSSCCTSSVLPATSTPRCRPVRPRARSRPPRRRSPSPARSPHRARATTGGRGGACAWRRGRWRRGWRRRRRRSHPPRRGGPGSSDAVSARGRRGSHEVTNSSKDRRVGPGPLPISVDACARTARISP